MSFFVSAEQRQRSAQFDYYVESCDLVLKHPGVSGRLGMLASALLEINDGAFVPNFRHGNISIPRAEKHSRNLMIVPVAQHEENEVSAKIDATIEKAWPTKWSDDEIFRSPTYGLEILADQVAEELFGQDKLGSDQPAQFTPDSRAVIPTLAVTGDLIRRISEPKKNKVEYWSTRPYTVVADTLLQADPVGVGGFGSHEHAHVLDRLSDGPMTHTFQYRAASEMRGYHVSYSVFDSYGQDGRHPMSSDVEALRRRGTHPDRPFVPAARWVMDEMVELGVIR